MPSTSALSPEAQEGTEYVVARGAGAIMAYIAEEMDAGRLRRTHPVLATQSLIGPLLVHLMTRTLAERRLGLDMPLSEAATQLAQGWLHSMRPEPEEAKRCR